MKMIRRIYFGFWTALFSGLVAVLTGTVALAQNGVNHLRIVHSVPTIQEWGVIIMSVMLAALALYFILRKIKTT